MSGDMMKATLRRNGRKMVTFRIRFDLDRERFVELLSRWKMNMRRDPTPTFNVGDNVAYSAQWLRSIGEYTGRLPALRGKVIGLTPLGQRVLVEIEWNDGSHGKVIADNLAHVGPNRRFASCD